MANHVSSHLNFERISDEGKEFVRKLVKDRLRTEGDHNWFPDLFVDGTELTYEQSEQYAWTIENIGAKWSFIEEFDEDFLSFNIQSAWSPPIEGVVKLLEMISEVDPDVVAFLTYEDEMPNFIGVASFTCEGLNDQCEWDWDELRDIMMAEIDGLASHWDEEEEDFDDEGRDLMWEHQWEIFNDLQEEWRQNEAKWLFDNENEEE